MTDAPSLSRLSPVGLLALLAAFAAVQALVLHLMGQPWICACGVVRFWTGVVLGPENSQQVTDWYTFSHVLHGMIFYGAIRLLLPRLPLLAALAIALGLEVSWELLENSPPVIARYREQALAQGYSGDSVLNSVSDTVAMTIGFVAARLMPVRATVAIGLAFEIFTAVMIRDNLTLNVIQLIHPVEAIAAWQGGVSASPHP
jgi:hypothetical protein